MSDAIGQNQETAIKEAGIKSNQVSTEGHKNAETSEGTRGSDDGKHKVLGTSSRIAPSRHPVKAAKNPLRVTATTTVKKQIA